LVYVVNRRTVVDQATREAENLQRAIVNRQELNAACRALRSLAARPRDTPLAISTLRGQFADNAEWREDPARPAIIVGTVDMIGSRLLFSGYGCGFKSRPTHAGFLGQDSLIVHDEAHLEPAFQSLLESIREEQARCDDARGLRIMALTATSRDGRSDASGEVFGLTEREREPESQPSGDTPAPLLTVWKRTTARKGLALHSVKKKEEIPTRILELALQYAPSGLAILIFARTIDDVQKVRSGLEKAKHDVRIITGTMRGLERDRMATEDAVLARFLRKSQARPAPGTVFLVCTSAGEVGIDLSADHMICDLIPFDSLAQRLGRVNRFGEGDANIDVVHVETPTAESGPSNTSWPQGVPEDATTPDSALGDESTSSNSGKDTSPFGEASTKTRSLLMTLRLRGDTRLDASPYGLSKLDADQRRAAFSPPPVKLTATDMIFDAWSLTSVRSAMPGRPPVADWLHGLSAWEPPDTHLAWREEVGQLGDCAQLGLNPEELLGDYPLKPHELVRDRAYRVLAFLKKLGKRAVDQGDTSVAWIVEPDDHVTTLRIADLEGLDQRDVAWKTVLLPPTAGGLSVDGSLDVSKPHDPAARNHDVADEWFVDGEKQERRRRRVWDDEERPAGMRLIRTIDLRPDADGEDEGAAPHRFWRWYVKPRFADDDGSRHAASAQELTAHLSDAERYALRLAGALHLGETEATALAIAARWHDRGKRRLLWQRSIGNRQFPGLVLAKSGTGMRPLDLGGYRHELGSLVEAALDPEMLSLEDGVRDLALHLIAAHHGRGRPHFPNDEVFDAGNAEQFVWETAAQVPGRFGRLQRAYGRWGLAWLESLLKAADVMASQDAAGGEDAL
jgi:CRISPR-associated endonuclease/helicase Cas3